MRGGHRLEVSATRRFFLLMIRGVRTPRLPAAGGASSTPALSTNFGILVQDLVPPLAAKPSTLSRLGFVPGVFGSPRRDVKGSQSFLAANVLTRGPLHRERVRAALRHWDVAPRRGLVAPRHGACHAATRACRTATRGMSRCDTGDVALRHGGCRAATRGCRAATRGLSHCDTRGVTLRHVRVLTQRGPSADDADVRR